MPFSHPFQGLFFLLWHPKPFEKNKHKCEAIWCSEVVCVLGWFWKVFQWIRAETTLKLRLAAHPKLSWRPVLCPKPFFEILAKTKIQNMLEEHR